MNKRIIRALIQLAVIASLCFFFAIIIDNTFSVLPDAIHNHLPAHHPGQVITDITIKKCSKGNPFSKCQLDPDEWVRIDKDLYLGKGWATRAFLHLSRKQEKQLAIGEKVVVDVKVGRVNPGSIEPSRTGEAWESRPGGIWLLRSAKRHETDSGRAVTAVDVLYGPDATDPRPGWRMRDTPLLIDAPEKGLEPHITVRTGPVHNIEKPVPRIRRDGKFKIMQASDLHLATGLGVCRDPEPKDLNGGNCEADTRTLQFVAKLLDQEKPDLVVLSGDQVNGDTAPDAQSPIFKLVELFIKRQIPYAAIFGNHDDEDTLSRDGSMSILESLPYSLSEPGPSSVSGVGNYFIDVLAAGTSQHAALTLYMLDTHTYSPDEKKYHGYDWLKDDQIKWFKDTSQILKARHSRYTKIHMDMAFIHIPLPEYRDPDNAFVGQWKEGVTAPNFNSHFKDALVEEGVLAVSCGHDHANDYCALAANKETKKPELWMCYAGGSGFGGYGGYGGYHRRIRFFEIDANSARISTWKRLEYGETEKRLDEQIIVDGGRVSG